MGNVLSRTWKRMPARRLACAVARLLVALVVVAGIAQSGSRYFYCEALGLSATDPCRESARSHVETCPTQAFRAGRADCCEIVTLPSVPSGAESDGPTVPSAGIAAVVPAKSFVLHLDEASWRTLGFARWRESPRSRQRARERSMVSLT